MSQASKGFQLDNSMLLQRWRALAPREQLALASLGGFLLLVLLYLALWQPAQQRLLAARAAFETQRELTERLDRQRTALNDLLRGWPVQDDDARSQLTPDERGPAALRELKNVLSELSYLRTLDRDLQNALEA